MKIHIITGSTRPNRKSHSIAQWAHEVASKRSDASFELVDIADYNLPLLDEPLPPLIAEEYTKDHTKKWAAKIAEADGFIFVTPEYNAGVSGALKNAIDFLHAEWANKAVGFVGYGSVGGARVIEQLRGTAGELQMADVRETLNLFLHQDFEEYTMFVPTDQHARQLNRTIDQVVEWAQALRTVRNQK